MSRKKLEPVTPGEILVKEFMEPLGISQNRLARDIGVPVPRIHHIVNGKRAITPDTALRLARYFGTSAEVWLNLQQHYDLKVARRRLERKIIGTVRPVGASRPA
jgi:addiction module HigA family antidote